MTTRFYVSKNTIDQADVHSASVHTYTDDQEARSDFFSACASVVKDHNLANAVCLCYTSSGEILEGPRVFNHVVEE